jgi:hypothetical protein
MVANAASSVCTVSGRLRIRTVIRVAIAIVPSDPTRRAEQIGSGRIGERAAEMHDLAVGHHRLDFEYVVNGEPILQAVRTAGIFSDVPTNRAHLLAGRIGCVVEAERRHLTRDFEIGDAWLDQSRAGSEYRRRELD